MNACGQATAETGHVSISMTGMEMCIRDREYKDFFEDNTSYLEETAYLYGSMTYLATRQPVDCLLYTSIATCYSDASLAEKELGWKAENGIKEMCEDSWRWQKNNPNGYEE